MAEHSTAPEAGRRLLITSRMPVRWGDMDAVGHLNNTLYFRLMEQARIQWLDRLGIAGYGFAPLRLPPDLDFAALFHGVDERVPIDAVRFGTRVLRRLLEDC